MCHHILTCMHNFCYCICHVFMLGLLLKDPPGKQYNKHNTNFTIAHTTRGPSRVRCMPDCGCRKTNRLFVDGTQVSSLKWLYSKQPKLGLTQEFVVDCAHALWVVHSTKRLVSLMLLKWFLSDSFIYFMYRMLNENF